MVWRPGSVSQDFQAWNTLEVPHVARHQGFAVFKRRGGDPQIVCADQFTPLFQEAENFAVMPGVGIVYWAQLELGFLAVRIGCRCGKDWSAGGGVMPRTGFVCSQEPEV
jgi:hypothetical protein